MTLARPRSRQLSNRRLKHGLSLQQTAPPFVHRHHKRSEMQNSVNITIDNFQQVILQDSTTQLVMLEFWAQGYEPSEQLAPVLQAIAHHGTIWCAKPAHRYAD